MLAESPTFLAKLEAMAIVICLSLQCLLICLTLVSDLLSPSCFLVSLLLIYFFFNIYSDSLSSYTTV